MPQNPELWDVHRATPRIVLGRSMYLSSALLSVALACLGIFWYLDSAWDFTSYKWRHVEGGAHLVVGLASLKFVVDFFRVLVLRSRIEIDRDGVHECRRDERLTTYGWDEIIALRLKPNLLAGAVFLTYRVKMYEGDRERESTATVSFNELHYPNTQHDRLTALLSEIDVSVLSGMRVVKTSRR